MPWDKNIELAAQLGEELDEVAATEQLEDERVKTQQAQSGGALEVCIILPASSWWIAISAHATRKRYINYVSAINFSFVLQCSWEAAAGTFQFSLENGGPASITYGSIFSGIGTTLIAISLAEMASM